MKRPALIVLAYVVATFATQAASHFAVFKAHYAAFAFLRPEPVFALGILSMLIQGSVLAVVDARLGPPKSVGEALRFAWLAGALLVSYVALAEPAKETVPSLGAAVGVEALAGFVQFTVFGLLLALVRPRATAARS